MTPAKSVCENIAHQAEGKHPAIPSLMTLFLGVPLAAPKQLLQVVWVFLGGNPGLSKVIPAATMAHSSLWFPVKTRQIHRATTENGRVSICGFPLARYAWSPPEWATDTYTWVSDSYLERPGA